MSSDSVIIGRTSRAGVGLLKLLGDETRLKILRVLAGSGGEVCVKELAGMVGVSPSATSHQLAKLEMHGVVEAHRDGQTVCYTLRETETVEKILSILNILT